MYSGTHFCLWLKGSAYLPLFTFKERNSGLFCPIFLKFTIDNFTSPIGLVILKFYLPGPNSTSLGHRACTIFRRLLFIYLILFIAENWLEDKGAEEGHTKFSQDWHFTWWKMKLQQRLWRMCTYMLQSHTEHPKWLLLWQICTILWLVSLLWLVFHVATCTKYNIPVLLLQIFSYGVIFVVLAIMCIAHQNFSRA